MPISLVVDAFYGTALMSHRSVRFSEKTNRPLSSVRAVRGWEGSASAYTATRRLPEVCFRQQAEGEFSPAFQHVGGTIEDEFDRELERVAKPNRGSHQPNREQRFDATCKQFLAGLLAFPETRFLFWPAGRGQGSRRAAAVKGLSCRCVKAGLVRYSKAAEPPATLGGGSRPAPMSRCRMLRSL